jgi:hypothetical protein
MECLKRVRKRLKRCYELAGRAMQEEPGAEKFTLVHGQHPTYHGHAWIETGDGRVYDPTTNAYTPIGDYAGVAQCRYTQREAMRVGCANRHWGPWHHMQYGIVGDRRVSVGHIMERGEAGFAAYDTNTQLVGNFPNPDSATAAAVDAAIPGYGRRFTGEWAKDNERRAAGQQAERQHIADFYARQTRQQEERENKEARERFAESQRKRWGGSKTE